MTDNELSKLRIDKSAWRGAVKRPTGRVVRVVLILAFGAGMGLLGGLVPALRAARIKSVDTLMAA